MNPLGVIQGRLVKKYKGRFQAHPVGYWQEEFKLARSLDLDCIEFILDFNDLKKNPLFYKNGTDEILKLIEETSVKVRSICADYFMESPIHTKNSSEAKRNMTILNDLISTADIIGVKDIVIPCVDQSSLKSESDIDLFIRRINKFLPDLDHKNINLSLETDLSPSRFLDLLDRFNSNKITVNYDIGNSASLGYDPIEELDAYGNKISDIHIKDRLLNGPSVVLGDGAADFERFFLKLKNFNYKGPFIMQAYRDDEGIGIFKSQLDWIKPFLEQYND